MIKLVSVESREYPRLVLRFSDGTSGLFDFTQYVAAKTEMTVALNDPNEFACHFIEAGALAWPNGFDLSAESLHRYLKDQGALQQDESGEPLIVSEAGVPYSPEYSDPFDVWIELMDVVEALCPRWPEREHRIEGVFLL